MFLVERRDMKASVAPAWLSRERIIIFALAFCVRALLAYIFYGSIDVTAFIGINRHTLLGTLVLHPFSIWCAFPVIPFYLWLSGFLAMVTPLPLAFCFKLIPVLFDSLIACLLFDIIRCYRQAMARPLALLYAFSPVALLVVSIHGQWDSLPLFFLLLGFYARECCGTSLSNYFIFGATFAFSILLKPIALVLTPFFFVPFQGIKAELGRLWYAAIACIGFLLCVVCAAFFLAKTNSNVWNELLTFAQHAAHEYVLLLGGLCGIFIIGLYLLIPWRRFSIVFQQYLYAQCASVCGFAFMTACCFGLLAWYGFDMIAVIDKVFRYFNQGVTVFGLPFAYPFNQAPWIIILKNRFWLMGLIALVAYFYYEGKVAIFEALGLSFALIFSFSGLCPQYLLWLIPFLMISRQISLFALYNIVVASYMLFYYAHPLGNSVVPCQNMLSFAALHGWAWIMPPPAYTSDWIAPVINCLGNYMLPLVCMIIIVVGMIRIAKRSFRPPTLKQPTDVLVPYVSFPILLTAGIAASMVWCRSLTLAQQFDAVIARSWGAYDYVLQSGMRVANYQHGSWCNIIVLFLLLLVIWGGGAAWVMRQAKRGAL